MRCIFTHACAGSVHYFSDSSDIEGEDVVGDEEDEAHGEEATSLMATIKIGPDVKEETAVSSSHTPSHATDVAADLSPAVTFDAQCAAAARAATSLSAPSSQTSREHDKPVAAAAPPSVSYAPSARMCSSVVVKVQHSRVFVEV
jgi:hypothetical protein